MARYKVGDRVVVREDLVEGVRYAMENGLARWVFIDGMRSLCGKVVTIKDVRVDCYRLNEFVCSWTDEMFVGLESEVFANPTPVDDLL